MKPSEVIKTYGWVQGRWGNIDIGFCAASATVHVIPGYDNNCDFFKKLRKHIGLKPNDSILIWNDDPAQTKEKVIEALEAAEQ